MLIRSQTMPQRIPTSYDEAVRFLGTFTNFSKTRSYEAFETVAEDLAEFRSVLRALGEPHLQYSVVHVAGSKGKGSTCSYLASTLRRAGRRTGLLISPHLRDWTERYAVDGEHITRGEFAGHIARLRGLLSDGPDPLHRQPLKRLMQRLGLRPPPRIKRHFRNAHAYHDGVGFLHFARAKVDFAVIETGMGGRLDHTNMFDQPPDRPDGVLVTAITTMALEHRISLGTTIRQIADHKAGIIRPHGLAVLGPQKPEWLNEVREAVEARRRAINAPPVLDVNAMIHVVPGSETVGPEGSEAVFRSDPAALGAWLGAVGEPDGGAARELAVDRGLKLRTPLPGRHQVDNLRTVLGCVLALGARGTRLTTEQVADGVAATRWPGRFEIMSRDPLVIVDCCHESLSIEAFARTYREFYGDRPVVAVIGFLRDNEIAAMCRAMVPHLPLRRVICCKPNLPGRGLDPEKAIPVAAPILGVPVDAVNLPRDAMIRAREMRRGNEALVVFADMYIVGEAREFFGEGKG